MESFSLFLLLIVAPPPEQKNELEELAQLFKIVAREFQIDEDLLKAIAYGHSKFYHHICPSIDGRYGIMGLKAKDTLFVPSDFELTPVSDFYQECETHDEGVKTLYFSGKLALIAGNLKNNIRVSAYLLRKYLDKNNGNIEKALDDYFHNELIKNRVIEILENGFDNGIIRIKPRKILKEEPSLPQLNQPELDSIDQWIPADSSNYTSSNRPGSYPIDYVIIHTIQGSYEGAISWFQNPDANVSTHYVLRSDDGHSTQMVLHKDVAWHAGNWNYNTWSVGTEHEGWVEQNGWYTDAVMKKSAYITRWMVNLFTVLPDRDHIIGHSEVPGATHTDPGPYWDWTYYMALVDYLFSPDTLVDDLSKGFKRGGPYASWWFRDTVGFGRGGHLFYTYTWTNPVLNWARWTPNLPYPGQYEVFVYVPNSSDFNANVRYRVYHRDGRNDVWIDQGNWTGQWVSLGVYPFNPGVDPNNGSVTLGDTSDTGGEKIAFDAVRFHLVQGDTCFNIVDDGGSEWIPYGNWVLSNYTGYAGDYHYANVNSGDSVLYGFSVSCSGMYEISVWIRKGSNRTTSAHYRLYAQNINFDFWVNQYSTLPNDTGWIIVDTIDIVPPVKVGLYTDAPDGDVVISDAIRLNYIGSVETEEELSDSTVKWIKVILEEGAKKLKLWLPKARGVRVSLYGVDGRRIRQYTHFSPGLNILPLPDISGVYFLRIDAKNHFITKKLIVLPEN